MPKLTIQQKAAAASREVQLVRPVSCTGAMGIPCRESAHRINKEVALQAGGPGFESPSAHHFDPSVDVENAHMHTSDAHMPTDIQWIDLADYAKKEGINRTTALRRVQAGKVEGRQVFEGARPKWLVRPATVARQDNYHAVVRQWKQDQLLGIGTRRNKPLSEKTVAINEYGLTLLWRFSGHTPTLNLSPALFEAALRAYPHDRMARNDHFSMKEKMHRAVVSFAKALVRYGYIESTVVEALKGLKPGNSYEDNDEFEALTLEQVRAFFKCNKAWRVGRSDYDVQLTQIIIALGVYAGLRREEIVTLRLVDVCVEAGYLVVWRKGNKRHEVPICSDLAALIVTYLRWRPRCKTPTFLVQGQAHRYGLPLTSDLVYKRVAKLGKYAGIRAYPHILRHTFATILDELGFSLHEVQRVLGHSSPQVTSRYVNVDKKRLREKLCQTSFM